MIPEKPTDDISLAVVHQKYLPSVSRETIERMCREGDFKTAFKPSGRKRSHWRVKRLEAIQIAHRNSGEFLQHTVGA